MENYLRRGIRGARFRVDKRLDRAAVSRAHDVLYLSDAWTEATWLGAQALKNPLDLWVYQEIMFETRPELVVETGTYRGGSAFFLASICDLLGAGEVVSIDIEPVRDDYPSHPRITYLGGRSSTDPDVLAEVRARAEGKRTLVILDSDHSQGHVEAELAEYAQLVPVGGYVIVEDSNIGQIRKDLLPGPLEAIETFLATTRRVRDRPRAREVPDHVQPERLPAPRALAVGQTAWRSSVVRRRADDADRPVDPPEHEVGGRSLGDARARQLDARLRVDVLRPERLAGRELEHAVATRRRRGRSAGRPASTRRRTRRGRRSS